MNETQPRSLGRTVVAVMVLLVAVWLALKFVIGIAAFLFSIVLIVLVIAAIVWALRVLL
jgi:hypothetical protein